MTASETIFQNLFTLLAATPGIVTSARRLPQVSNVSQAVQPALYMLEGEEDIAEKAGFALAKYEIHCAAIVFFRNTGGPNEVASMQMNALRDAVIQQMQQKTLLADGVTVVPLLGGLKQTLGGVVYHARIVGRLLKNEGLINNQGAIVFPISIISGM